MLRTRGAGRRSNEEGKKGKQQILKNSTADSLSLQMLSVPAILEFKTGMHYD